MNKLSTQRFSSLKKSGLHTANLPLASEVELRRKGVVGPAPFITISRQIGAGLCGVPGRLAEALNADGGNGSKSISMRWSSWDHELLEKVSQEHHIPLRDIEGLEQSGHSWLDSFIGGIGGLPDELVILHRMTQTVRELAIEGRVILAGHGSSLMTRDMKGGLHFRLVAPPPWRVANIARAMNLPTREAARKLSEMERARRGYIKRFWPNATGAPEQFTATFNTAQLDEGQIVAAMIAVIQG